MTKLSLIARPRWTTPEEDDRLRRVAAEGRSSAVTAERLKRGENQGRAKGEKQVMPQRPPHILTYIERKVGAAQDRAWRNLAAVNERGRQLMGWMAP